MKKQSKLIINADDFGKTHSINEAIAECFSKGYISNTTIMVNMSYADEAVNIAKDEGFFDKVGLHVNLTEGISLSGRLMKDDFNDMNGVVDAYSLYHLPKDISNDVKAEIQFQIKKFLDYGFTERHMDFHHHKHVRLSVLPIYLSVFKEYKFNSTRLTKNIGWGGYRLRAKAYKSYVNRRIKSYSRCTTDLFGGFDDYLIGRKSVNSDKMIELMCHPDYEDGKLVNLYAGDGIEKDIVKFHKNYLVEYNIISYSDFL